MFKVSVYQSKFSARTIKGILKYLEYVNFDQPRNKILEQIEEVSPQEYIWGITENPAYFIQYQIDSCAILKVNSIILIVWKPKYIEYPAIIQFPPLKDKKLNSMKVELQAMCTTTANTNEMVVNFVQKFYGTYFYSDQNFETNLVTFCKHFISKTTAHSYWHALLDNTGKLFVSNSKYMLNEFKLRITGIKEGYDKTLYLFAYQGKRDDILSMVKNKWMQLFSFIGMVIVFYGMIGCNGGEEEGICQYRKEMQVGGAGLMLAIMALRFTKKKPKKDKIGLINKNSKEKSS